MFDIDPAEHQETFAQAGPRLYKSTCMACHGPDRKGSGNYPSIVDVNKKLNKDQFISFINAGRRMMPSFLYLPEIDKEAIASYVLSINNDKSRKYTSKMTAIDSFRVLPYEISGYNKFYTKTGAPGLSPPWGVLNAVDLNSGDYVWKNVLGENQFPGAPSNTGCENYGGPIVTKGGLLCVGATKDGMFRIFNKRTGKLLWQTQLPAAAFSTPATYEVDGKQYIVIACGGGKLGTKSGDSYVAFALPGK